MECGPQGLGTQRVYQAGLGSFRRLRFSWHLTVRSGMWRSRIFMGRVTLMHVVSVVAGQEV